MLLTPYDYTIHRCKMAMFSARCIISTIRGPIRMSCLSPTSLLTTRSRDLITTTDQGPDPARPPSSDVLPRPAGITSMYRLPVQQHANDLDVGFVGVPMDIGTSNRPGTRFGPRQIREMSVHVGQYNNATGADPYSSLRTADLGDVYINQFHLPRAVKGIKKAFSEIVNTGCKTIALGGDHTITYPILQAVSEVYGPVALIHVDAHDDTVDTFGGEKISHASPFRRAGEEGCLDLNRVVQIGLRGPGYSRDDYEYGQTNGFRIIRAEDCWHKSMTPLMSEIRNHLSDVPVYLSFDIDALDPAFAPGTGTPEIGGLTTIQALEIIRGCKGLNIIGCDLVEVSPPYDSQGVTALVAANLLFEMLCVIPEVRYQTQ